MRTISTSDLVSLSACSNQVDLFNSLFNGVGEFTLEKISIAVNAGLNIEWLVPKILTPEQLEIFRNKLFFAKCELNEQLNVIRQTLVSDKRIMTKEAATQKYNEAQSQASATFNEILTQAFYDGLSEE